MENSALSGRPLKCRPVFVNPVGAPLPLNVAVSVEQTSDPLLTFRQKTGTIAASAAVPPSSIDSYSVWLKIPFLFHFR